VLEGKPGFDYAAIAAPRPGREADVDRPQGPRRQEQGDLDRRPRPKFDGPHEHPSRPNAPRTDPRRRARRHGRGRDHRHGQPGQEPARLTPDGRRIITSDDVTTKADLPKSIAIVGAGAVGSEFASLFHDLGVAVTLLEYLPGIVPLEDKDAARSGAQLHAAGHQGRDEGPASTLASVKVSKDGVTLSVGPEGAAAETEVEQLLIATGRAPNTENLGLEKTKVELDRGFVKVDGWMRTAEPHVYAIGDAIGGLMLAHVAAHEGITAAHTIAGESLEAIDYDHQPRATYTHPQVASIGLTEQQCAERGIAIKKGTFNFAAVGKAVIVGETEGFAKVIADATTDRVLGRPPGRPQRYGPDC
jgi:dihydrolipoamide dehydrogenase